MQPANTACLAHAARAPSPTDKRPFDDDSGARGRKRSRAKERAAVRKRRRGESHAVGSPGGRRRARRVVDHMLPAAADAVQVRIEKASTGYAGDCNLYSPLIAE